MRRLHLNKVGPVSPKEAERVAKSVNLRDAVRELTREQRRRLARRVGKSGCNGIGGRNGVPAGRASFHGPLRLSKTIAHHGSEAAREADHGNTPDSRLRRKLRHARERDFRQEFTADSP